MKNEGEEVPLQKFVTAGRITVKINLWESLASL
jgi:hypothetical protein